MPVETERDRLHAARCRWLLTVLYLGGLRAAEVASTRMGALFCRRDREGVERWRLEVTGKGNKTRLVPAMDELILELVRYRKAHDLPPGPFPGKERPLVLPFIGRRRPLFARRAALGAKGSLRDGRRAPAMFADLSWSDIEALHYNGLRPWETAKIHDLPTLRRELRCAHRTL